jgi:hypothetical protein
VNLLVSARPNRSGPVVILALFKACLTRYYRRLSLSASSALSSRVAALVSLLALLFPVSPK